jgi:methionyl-tRNA formyltransferase
VIGAPLLVSTLRDLAAGSLAPEHQRDGDATLASKVEPSEFELDPSRSAIDLERVVRAFFPRAFVWFRDRRLQVRRADAVAGDGEAGTLADVSDDPVIQTVEGRLRLLEVQPEGKRAMSGGEFVRGYRPEVGERIGPRV